jgi:hypothetical protein
MAEDTTGKIVNTLRTEGQLTRNTGTNSIKSIGLRLNNLAPVFNAINGSLQQQTRLLEDAFDLQAESIRDNARRDRFGDDDGGDPTPPAPEPESSGNTNAKAFKDAVKDAFTLKNVGIAAAAAAAAPYIAGLIDGALTQITGGKWSDFKDFIKTKLPDVMAGLKKTLALIYGNISDFFETKDINDLLKDENGVPIVDIKNLKEKANIFVTTAVSAMLLGPLGAIGAAIGFALTGALESLTGFDIPESVETGLALLIGVGAATVGPAMLLKFAMGNKGAKLPAGAAKRGLIYRTMMMLVRSPYGMVAAAIGLALMAANDAIDDALLLNKEAQDATQKKLNQARKELNVGATTDQVVKVIEEAATASNTDFDAGAVNITDEIREEIKNQSEGNRDAESTALVKKIVEQGTADSGQHNASERILSSQFFGLNTPEAKQKLFGDLISSMSAKDLMNMPYGHILMDPTRAGDIKPMHLKDASTFLLNQMNIPLSQASVLAGEVYPALLKKIKTDRMKPIGINPLDIKNNIVDEAKKKSEEEKKKILSTFDLDGDGKESEAEILIRKNSEETRNKRRQNRGKRSNDFRMLNNDSVGDAPFVSSVHGGNNIDQSVNTQSITNNNISNKEPPWMALVPDTHLA